MLFLSGCVSNQCAIENSRYYQVKAYKPYSDVLAELELAITERNFRITGHNKIGRVIREREQIDFPDYDSLQFCNLTLARQMLEIAPEALVYMHCIVSVRAEAGSVIVTTHLLPTDFPNSKLNEFARQMNEKLKQIEDFASAE